MHIKRHPLTTVLGLSLATLAFTTPAPAADFVDYGQVVSSTPIYERFNEPKRECWFETVTPQASSLDPNNPAGAIIGGLAGGILGNQVGKGTGKTLATAAGAITGAIVGERLQGNTANAGPSTQTIERCRITDHWVQRLSGYSVVYRYQGHEYTAVLPNDPGRTLRINVQVTPY